MTDDEDTGFGEVLANPDAVWKDEEAPRLPQMIAQRKAQLDDERVSQQLTVLRPDDMPELPINELVKLAREVATNIRELPDVLKHYNLTEAHYAYLSAHHEFFKQALRVSLVEWNSALSAPDRVKLQSAAILEDALPRLGARMCNPAEGLPAVVEAAKFFAKIAGLGERDVGDRSPSEKFTISINLGGDQKITYKSPEPTVEVSALPIRDDSKT